MHCLLIHQAFVSKGQGGGTRHFEFGEHLTQQGDHFTVIASDVSYLDGSAVTAPTEEQVSGIKIIRARTPRNIHKSFFHRVWGFVGFTINSVWLGWKNASRADIVMGTSPSLFQALGAWVVAALRRKPFLLEVRDLWPEFAVSMGVLKSPTLIFLSRKIESFLYWRSCHILVNSPAYVNYLRDRGVNESEISLIPNGVNPDMFDESSDITTLRSELGLNDAEFIVVYTGALGPANDIKTILDAAQRLLGEVDIKFILAGSGKSQHETATIVREKCLKNVELVGVLPKERVSKLLNAANCCVATLMNIPSFNTTYPNKVFDYMAAGKPTLLGIDGVIRSVIEESDGGVFFDPGDSKMLADAILLLRANELRCREMGENARKFVTERFNRKNHVVEFRSLLHKLADA